MDIVIYLIVASLLFILILLYYWLIKPKDVNLTEIFKNQLLSSKNAARAFTHKKLKDGTYVNYFINYDDEDKGLLIKSIDPYPVKKNGEKYSVQEHGSLTITKNGFRVSGITTDFQCPDQWYWENGQCKIKPICNLPEDIDMIKGVNYYAFHNYNFQKNLGELKSSEVSYHDKLYVKCLEDGSYEINKCPNDTLYNQLEVQPGTDNPCIYYDICEDMSEFTIHINKIDDYVLKDNEYYICVDRKSQLKSCPENTAFNIDLNGCVDIDKCYKKEDGFTIYNNENSYILCNQERENLIQCRTEVMQVEDVYQCKIDKLDGFVEFFNSDYLIYPIAGYEYNDVTNTKTIIKAPAETKTLTYNLESTTNPFFTRGRQDKLYPDISYNKYFLEYENKDTKTKINVKEITDANYKQFVYYSSYNTSWFKSLLETVVWDVFENRPVTDEGYIFYKNNKLICNTVNDKTHPSIDYFYFVKNGLLFRPKPTLVFKDVDEPTGMLLYAVFNAPKDSLMSDNTIIEGYSILKLTKITPKNYLMYTYDYFNNTLQAIVFNSEIVNEKTFKNVNGKISSTFFNYQPIEQKDKNKIYFRINCIQWSGMTFVNLFNVFPDILTIFNITDIKFLDKQFSLLDEVELTETMTLIEYTNKIETDFDEITEFKGDVKFFTDIQNQLIAAFIDVYNQ